MAIQLEHLRLYRDVAMLLMRFGRSDVVKQSGLPGALGSELPADPGASPPQADELAAMFEKMGPTFIKLGQLLSTRPDILPPAYADALTRLQDDCKPFPFEEVVQIVESEIGVRISKLFTRFDREPAAAASMAQVHYATMRDGREVAVKVQRPGVRERAATDIEALANLAAFFDVHTEVGRRYEFGKLVEEFRKSLWRELDFRQEAQNLVTLRANLAAFRHIVVPAPVLDFTTTRVLTMEFVHGRKVTALSPVVRLEVDGELLADELFHAYLKQMLGDGFFHADPHPGNVFLVERTEVQQLRDMQAIEAARLEADEDDDEGDRHLLALIDLGMVAHVSAGMQDRLLQLVLAISDRRPDDAAKAILSVGDTKEDADEKGFRRDLAEIVMKVQDATIAELQFGRVVLDITRVANLHGFGLPPEFAMIGKTLLNLDQIGRTLAPEFDPNAAIRRHVGGIVEQRLASESTLGNLLQGAIEVKNLARKLPARLDMILDHVARNELRFRVDTIDENALLAGLQKVANRIAVGLILAALIVGAAMLVDVPTGFTLLGYPGIAFLMFVAAAAGGVMLVASILITDVKARKRKT